MKKFIIQILKDMHCTFFSYLKTTCIFLVILLLISIFYIYIKYVLQKKKVPRISANDIIKIIFVFALVGCYFMIFSEAVFSRPSHSRESLRLVFYFGTSQYFGKGWRELAENIVFFIPLGFLWTIFFNKKRYFVILISFFSSLSVETVQLMTGRGYFQISDLVMNTLGGTIGFLCFIIIQKYIIRIK